MIDTYHASRKPKTKKEEDNFDKIDWKSEKFSWVNPEELEENKKAAEKANKHLRE